MEFGLKIEERKGKGRGIEIIVCELMVWIGGIEGD